MHVRACWACLAALSGALCGVVIPRGRSGTHTDDVPARRLERATSLLSVAEENTKTDLLVCFFYIFEILSAPQTAKRDRVHAHRSTIEDGHGLC